MKTSIACPLTFVVEPLQCLIFVLWFIASTSRLGSGGTQTADALGKALASVNSVLINYYINCYYHIPLCVLTVEIIPRFFWPFTSINLNIVSIVCLFCRCILLTLTPIQVTRQILPRQWLLRRLSSVIELLQVTSFPIQYIPEKWIVDILRLFFNSTRERKARIFSLSWSGSDVVLLFPLPPS